MTRLLDFLKARCTAIDGTFTIWIGVGNSVGAGTPPDQLRGDSANMNLIR